MWLEGWMESMAIIKRGLCEHKVGINGLPNQPFCNGLRKAVAVYGWMAHKSSVNG